MVLENNVAEIAGEVIEPLTFSHNWYGEIFLKTVLKVERSSGTFDNIPCIVSERVLSDLNEGERIGFRGAYKSFNYRDDAGNTHLMLYVFVEEIIPAEYDKNNIHIEGFVCKPPIYRTTPLGREITDVLIAVNRSYGKSDYIPCIFWGRSARYVDNLKLGTKLSITGRMQSREYEKVINDTKEKRIAYEVSVSRFIKEE